MDASRPTDRPTVLVLDDGTAYAGRGFGSPAPTAAEFASLADSAAPKSVGEVVFNTAMAGYPEVLTDPSYTGQLVVMTYPHVGNYGCDPEWTEVGPEPDGRSGVKPAGFVVRSLYRGPVPDGRMTLDRYLTDHHTPGITGIDTRHLTLKLRDEGSRSGAIVSPAEGGAGLSPGELAAVVGRLSEFPAMEGRSLVGEVGSSEPVAINDAGSPHIALLDCGTKANIIRELVRAGCRVTLLPSDSDEAALEATGADALFVSNGPGDPAVLARQIELIAASIGRRPVLGICLGHQLISQALGAKTYKMKFGHHGVNHPVRDEFSKRVFVTSQNHGFAVDEATLPDGCSVWFRNANDGTVEGIAFDSMRIRTAQFHPEAAPGPVDSQWIFNAFLDVVR